MNEVPHPGFDEPKEVATQSTASTNRWAQELGRITTQYVEKKVTTRALYLGKPETAYVSFMVDKKPTAIQRFFLRKLLNLYYKEEVVKTLIPKP